MATIKINCQPGGKTKVETSGFSGPACVAAAAPYKNALGVPVEDSFQETAEYHQSGQEESRTEDA